MVLCRGLQLHSPSASRSFFLSPQLRRARLHGPFRGGLIATAEADGDASEACLQYELGVAVRLRTQLTLLPTLLYLSGLGEPVSTTTPRQLPDGTVIGVRRTTSGPNDALALGLQVRRAFGTGRLRPYVGGQGFLVSNSASQDGVLVGAQAGADYALKAGWRLGLRGHWNVRYFADTLLPMAGVGLTFQRARVR